MGKSLKAITAIVALSLSAMAGCGDDDGDSEGSVGSDGGDAAIVVEAPESDASVTSPVTISGTASVFEGTVQLRVLDADGNELGRGFATAAAGAPERGEFSEQVEFTVDEAQEGTIEAFEEDVSSGEGSGDTGAVSVPVQLEP
jgi:hypothetical protein